MDKQTKVEIKVVVRDAIREAMECYEERWLTDREMSQYISVLTQRWLRDHGDIVSLPAAPHPGDDGRRQNQGIERIKEPIISK